MAMRVQHRVQPANAFSQSLLAEVRTTVDDDSVSLPLDHHRRSRAPVSRVLRVADRAIASDRGNSHGGTAAQHRNRTWLHLRGTPDVPGPFCNA